MNGGRSAPFDWPDFNFQDPCVDVLIGVNGLLGSGSSPSFVSGTGGGVGALGVTLIANALSGSVLHPPATGMKTRDAKKIAVDRFIMLNLSILSAVLGRAKSNCPSETRQYPHFSQWLF